LGVEGEHRDDSEAVGAVMFDKGKKKRDGKHGKREII
jgi:hypothetical protein